MANDIIGSEQIFISYASDDQDRYVLPLIRLLQQRGYQTWFDRENIEGGDDWKVEIDQGLRTCIVLVAILTPMSADPNRRWVRYEQTQALRLFTPIVPVIVSDCDYPGYLHHINHLDMRPAAFDQGVAIYSAEKVEVLIRAIRKVQRRRGTKAADQTPPIGREFIGREFELTEISTLINSANENQVETARRIVAIQGMGGIGKTMLAEELLRRVGPKYPGGVLVVKRGQTPEPIQNHFQNWARLILGIEPQHDVSVEELRNLFSTIGEPLVLIDDVWPDDFNNVSKLLAALPPDADRIITTRFQDGAERIGAILYQLTELTRDDAIVLLRVRLKHKGPEPNDALLLRLYRLVNGHPLSLELAAGRIRDTTRMERLVERLEAKIRAGDISEFSDFHNQQGKDVSLQASLDESYAALFVDEDFEEGQLGTYFSALGIMAPDEQFDVEGAGAIWGEDDLNYVEDVLDVLVGYAVVSARGGRFSTHAVLAAYAIQHLAYDVPRYQRTISNYQQYFLGLTYDVADNWQEVDRQRPNIHHAANQLVDSCVPSDIVDRWGQPEPPLEEQHSPDEAYTEVLRTLAILGMTHLGPYIHHRRVHEGLNWLLAGLASSRLIQDIELEGNYLLSIGIWYLNRGELSNAKRYFERAANIGNYEVHSLARAQLSQIYRIVGDTELALAHTDFGDKNAIELSVSLSRGMALVSAGKYAEAIELLEDTRKLAEEENKSHVYAIALTNIGMAYNYKGEPENAYPYHLQAIEIYQEQGNYAGLGGSYNNLAVCAIQSDDYRKALEFLEKSRPLVEEAGDKVKLCTILCNLAKCFRHDQNSDLAIEYLSESLKLCRSIGSRPSLLPILQELPLLMMGSDPMDMIKPVPDVLLSLVEDALQLLYLYYNSDLHRNDGEHRQLASKLLFDIGLALLPRSGDIIYAYEALSETRSWESAKMVFADRPILLTFRALAVARILATTDYEPERTESLRQTIPLLTLCLEEPRVFQPVGVDDYLARARAYIHKRENDNAIADLSYAIEVDSDNAQAYFMRGALNEEKKQFQNAISDLDKAIALQSTTVEYIIRRANLYTSLGLFEEAERDYSRILEIEPLNVDIILQRGHVREQQQDWRAALSDFDRAISLSFDNSFAYYNRGVIYAFMNEFEKAITDFQNAVQLNPEYDKAYHNMGVAYYHIGENNQAVACFIKAASKGMVESNTQIVSIRLEQLKKHYDEKQISILFDVVIALAQAPSSSSKLAIFNRVPEILEPEAEGIFFRAMSQFINQSVLQTSLLYNLELVRNIREHGLEVAMEDAIRLERSVFDFIADSTIEAITTNNIDDWKNYITQMRAKALQGMDAPMIDLLDAIMGVLNEETHPAYEFGGLHLYCWNRIMEKLST